MTDLDKVMELVPPHFKDNPSAIKRILYVYKKSKREGRWGGYWTNELAELLNREPASNKRDEYELCEGMGTPSPLEFQDYQLNPY